VGIFDKIIASGRESRLEMEADRDLPPSVLSEEYEDFISDLPADVQDNVNRLKTIFKNDSQPIINYLDDIKDKGNSDYLDKGIYKELDNFNEKDVGRFKDFQALGKGMYDAMYRKDEEGSIARKKILDNKAVQLAIAPAHGLYTGVRGTAELVASLSDLYLDTETLDNVQRALPELSLNEIYGDDAGGLAKFISIMTQYGTGFGIASKIGKKIIGKGVKTKLAQKTAEKLGKTAIGKGVTDVAKFGGYYALPAGVADAFVSATGQNTVGEIFGREEGGTLQKLLYNTAIEETKDLQGKEKAGAILRNKLKFGTEGAAFMGTLKLIKPTAGFISKGLAINFNEIISPILTGGSKVLASEKSGVPQGLRFLSNLQDKALKKAGLPDSDLWKFSDFTDGTKNTILRGLDEITSRLKSGGKFNVQTRNELKKLDSVNRGIKKETDIFIKDLDREMYKIAKLGSEDILFNEVSRARALSYWDDVLKYMRGEVKINSLPKTLRPSSAIIRGLIDKQTELLQPILKNLNVKDDLVRNAGKYLHTSYEIFRNPKFRADKKVYNNAINYFKTLLKKSDPQYKGVAEKSAAGKKLDLEAKLTVNRLLELGRSEGTTPAKRLEAIANAANKLKIPKTTFNKFFSKEKTLPDEIGQLLGRTDDPKKIIMDTIVEQAHTVNSYNAFKEIADFGIGKFIFRNNEEYLKFLQENNITSARPLKEITVKKPYNVDLEKLFVNPDKTKMLALPEMAKAMQDTTLVMDTLLKLPMMKSLLAVKAAVQMNKTVLSVMTQMRNITTAAMFASANGHIGVGASVADNFNFMFKELIGNTKDPKQLRKVLKEALDAGALDSSTIAQELEQMIPELMGKSGIGPLTVTQGGTSDEIFRYLFTTKGPVGKVVSKAIEAYQMGDNIWKLYGYQYTKSQLRPAFKNMNDVKKYFREIEGYEFRPKKADGGTKTLDEAIQEIAGIQVRDTYPNYSMIPTAVQNIRKIPFFGNFVAFKSEMFRNSFQILRRGQREMRSGNPYIRQMGARRLIGYTSTVGIAIPVAMETAKTMKGLSDAAYNAYMERFSADYLKGHSLMPITEQQADHSWKYSDLNYLVPYADVIEPFKAGMQEIMAGKNTDQSSTDLYAKAARTMMMSVLDTFVQPSIAAETALELVPNNKGQFRTKQGGLIADINNDPDWLNKVIAHGFSKISPTTIVSGIRIGDAISGDLTKSGVKRDLYDEVLKLISGFGIAKADPYQSMRFKLGKYSGEIGSAKAAFTGDTVNATKLQSDSRLIQRGLPPQNITTEFERLQSNNYRILSEVYKDVKALRELDFTEKEIKDLLSGRRALSKRDVSSVMLGLFQPEPVPSFKKDTALGNGIKNINRELGTDYSYKDFVDRNALNDIRKKYKNIPLGLDDADRQPFFETINKEKLQDRRELLKDRRELLREQREDQSQLIKPQIPAADNIPMPDATMTAGMTANVNPMTRLTRTETALLSPEEQVIAQNRRGGIGSLI